ncbi:uncharacterized protein LOC109862033 [Pseudomyrmex gracilis]|uniref:uncharacterized protein LOC109862033 n=1 Tax=Pseudomyrmex gracilis TaxID=219809 RepID=UPI0009951423|nr:uncharacterized protein LOC109862033 [Pseudomyrmex gracilis]
MFEKESERKEYEFTLQIDDGNEDKICADLHTGGAVNSDIDGRGDNTDKYIPRRRRQSKKSNNREEEHIEESAEKTHNGVLNATVEDTSESNNSQSIVDGTIGNG